MATIVGSPIEEQVDRLFDEIKAKAKNRDFCINPVTGGQFIWGLDPIAPQKRDAVRALRAREWFAVEGGPLGAPSLPVSHDEIEDYRHTAGLKRVIGYYARSLELQDFDYRKHPSFHDFARGLMALAVKGGLRELEKDATLIERFPPLPLAGMFAGGAYWEPPKKQRRAA